MKVMSQLTNGNKIKRKIRNIKYRGKGQGKEGTSRANAFSYGLRTVIVCIIRVCFLLGYFTYRVVTI